MPIYEYTCPNCGHDFEKIMRVGAAPPPCPSCGESEVNKKISLSAFQLKGQGWYKDAYAGKDNRKPGSSAESKSSGGSESSSSDSGSSSNSSSNSGSKSSSEGSSSKSSASSSAD